MIPEESRFQALELLQSQRWGGLSTLDEDGAPNASMVAYGIDVGRSEILFYLSRLSAHTANMLRDPRIALVIGESDAGVGEGDPQMLARLGLQGQVTAVGRADADFERCKSVYLGRLPTAGQLFALGDFLFFRFAPTKCRFVGGFGRAFTLSFEELLG